MNVKLNTAVIEDARRKRDNWIEAHPGWEPFEETDSEGDWIGARYDGAQVFPSGD